jgi:hypothetical protein
MRALLRAFLLLLVIAVVGMFVLGYWTGYDWRGRPTTVGTTGTIDTEKARERGAELGEKAARATEKVKDTLSETSLTAKIKAKMALDDHVKARAIDVSTTGTTVTLTGTVSSRDERDRAMALARETEGVTHVVDALRVAR